MKPSGPGLLFVGRFLVTVSISVLVIDLFIFCFFLVQSWKVVLFYEFVHFFQVAHFIVIYLLVVISHDPLYFCSVNCYFSFFISNSIGFSLLFFLMSLDNGLSILFNLSKNQLLVY